ncbi:MAG: alpha-amylase family glycosyl hydrolase [Eubacteriales bacterium]|nr:alpha-amylase family glycosyl hydrolase [Eubacteriales bacterium]
MKIIAQKTAAVLLYDKEGQRPTERIDFDPANRIGNVWHLDDAAVPENVPYLLEIDGVTTVDPRATVTTSSSVYGHYNKRPVYGMRRTLQPFADGYTAHRMDELVIYAAHVRGFTASATYGGEAGGTFRALGEHAAYIRKMGFNAVELMPVYDFNECMHNKTHRNYWGYGKGHYYAPKPAYAGEDDPVDAFRTMVKQLHENGLDVILQMYFIETTSEEIIRTLVHWIRFYGVDGFHIIRPDGDLSSVPDSPYLTGTKLFTGTGGDREQVRCFDEGFLVDVRRFLRGEDNAARNLSRYFLQACHRVNFAAYHNGYTLYDVFSYEEKHNEANGEHNRDGTDYNYSMNFGTEGPAADETVREQRLRAVHNALLLTLTARDIPRIMMGDEVLRTQNGNNNAYCIDAEINYLNHQPEGAAADLPGWMRRAVAFRRQMLSADNPFGHGGRRAGKMPSVSVHQADAWQENILPQSKYFAVYYERKEPLLLVVNLSARKQRIGLPDEITGTFEQIIGTASTAAPERDGRYICPEPFSVAWYRLEKE